HGNASVPDSRNDNISDGRSNSVPEPTRSIYATRISVVLQTTTLQYAYTTACSPTLQLPSHNSRGVQQRILKRFARKQHREKRLPSKYGMGSPDSPRSIRVFLLRGRVSCGLRRK